MLTPYLNKVLAGHDLTSGEMEKVLGLMTGSNASCAQSGALLAALRGILCALPGWQPFRHTEQQHARQAGYQQEIDTLFIILPRRLQPGDALFCGHWVFSSV